MRQLVVQASSNVGDAGAVTDDGIAIALLRRCGRRALTPDGLDALREVAALCHGHDWDDVLGLARQHGLASLVFKHLAQAGLLPVVPTHIAAELRSAYCATLVTNRRLEIELGKIAVAFAARGVAVLPLKGVTLAARYYQEIALRPSHDIDVLVMREQLEQCLLALRDIGYLPKEGAGKALDFDVLYYLELDYRSGDGVRVEPHLELARLPAYRAALAVEQVWAHAQAITVGGVGALYLHPWDELQYLSVHYSVPHQANRLIWLVDIAELVRSPSSGWDWDGFVRETIARGLAAPVAVALQHAHDQLALELPPAVMPLLLAAAATPREREAWAAAHASSSDVGRLSRHFLSLPSVAEKGAFLWGAARVGGHKAARHLHHAFAARYRRVRR